MVGLGLSRWRLRRRRGIPQAIWRRWRTECVRRLFNRDVLSCRGRLWHCRRSGATARGLPSQAATSTRPTCAITASATRRSRRTRPGSATPRRPEAPVWTSIQQVLLGRRRCRLLPCRDLQRADESIHRRTLLAGEHPGTRALDLQVHQELSASGIRLAAAARLLGQRRALSRAVRRFRRARPRPLLVQVARGRGPAADSDPPRQLGHRASRPDHAHRHRRQQHRALLPVAVAWRRHHVTRLCGLPLSGSTGC